MTDWSPGPAWLFCPADRPDRYRKALDRADVVILDLEDAVGPDSKEAARAAVRQLSDSGELDVGRTVVRVNSASTPDHQLDLELTTAAGIRRVMLAKAECSSEVEAIPHEVIALLETPRGIERAGELASNEAVIGVMWGADDLVAGLGGTSSRLADGRYRDVVRYARARSLVAAKASGRLALDAVYMDIPDLDGLAVECLDAVSVGFDATVAIHPSQVAVIRESYRPSPDKIDWAGRLLAHVGEGRNVTTFEGRMVDGPIFKQAERVLRLASATTGAS